MYKKYLVTGKDTRNVYLRTDYLRDAMTEAKKHKYGFIHVYKKYLSGYVIMREVLNGKQVPIGTIQIRGVW